MKQLAIVVNFRTSRYLPELMRSLDAAGIAALMIHDNFSTEMERAEVEAAIAGKPLRLHTEVIYSSENLGFGAAVNRSFHALAPGDDDFVWIVNPDVVVGPESAEILANSLRSGDADIVSPAIVTGDATNPRFWFAGGVLNKRSGKTQHLDIGTPLNSSTDLRATQFVTGAAPMMKARTFKLLGGFREDLFLYWEDADLSYRAGLLGLKLAVHMGARVWHDVGGAGDGGGKSDVYYFYMQRNRFIVCSRWSSPIALLLGPGFIETVKLSLRPLRETDRRLTKFVAGLKGLSQGLKHVRFF